ncbi:MAG: hypothetical protein NTZ03_04910 [Actinobacteria bacterium]|nr:hypothetical protein [Actinomycetota bacterium]
MTSVGGETPEWSDDAERDGRTAALGETVAGGLGLLATFLSTVANQRDDAADHAAAARRALAPVVPLIVSDHDASAECRSCPVCRLLSMARLVAPEMVDGIGDALDAVMLALREELSRTHDEESQ